MRAQHGRPRNEDLPQTGCNDGTAWGRADLLHVAGISLRPALPAHADTAVFSSWERHSGRACFGRDFFSQETAGYTCGTIPGAVHRLPAHSVDCLQLYCRIRNLWSACGIVVDAHGWTEEANCVEATHGRGRGQPVDISNGRLGEDHAGKPGFSPRAALKKTRPFETGSH